MSVRDWSAGRRPRRLARSVAAVGAVLSIAMVVASCGSSGATGAESDASPELVAVTLTTSVPDGAGDISPLDHITVTAEDGALSQVSMTNPQGGEVEGEYSDDKLAWASSEE